LNLAVRTRLFIASVGVLLLAVVGTTLYLHRSVRATVEARAEAELVRHARTARIGVESLPTIDGPVGRSLATRFAEVTGARVDIMTGDDHLLASSTAGGAPWTPLPRDLPEIASILDLGQELAVARRGGELRVAVPFVRDGRRGIIRLAAPLADVDSAYARLYQLITIAGGVGLALAALMTWLAATLMSRALRRLANGARDVARGTSRRVVVETSDAIGDVGGSLNRMAEDVERALTALGRERALLAAVLEGMSQGLVALDGERRVTLINEAARTVLGVPTAPLGEAFLDQVRVPGLVELTQPPYLAGTVEVQMPTGTRVIARVTPMRSGDGAILTLQDVTNMRRLETIRRDFVANVSHELRTPVSVIRANAETLVSGALDDPRFASRMLEGVHRNAERLARILADLLDLSRLEAGQYRIELAPVDVAAAVEQALESVETPAASKQIAIEVDVDDGVAVAADAKALDQILINLIDNAVKYTPAGGHVWVSASTVSGERVRIEIRDDGPGIAPKHRERIFERFYRVDPGRSREMGGTGLGLSIVKHLVETMNGVIGVSENHPRGTVFWFELAPGLAAGVAPPASPVADDQAAAHAS